MIATIAKHPTQPGILIVGGRGTDINTAMGRFEPAHLSREDHGYLIQAEHLEPLRRHLSHHDIHLVDATEPAPTQTQVIANPLPECAGCGQPRRRHHAPPAHCPNCGRPWVDADPTRDQIRHTPTRPCPACGAHEKGAFAHCSRCGAAMGRPKLTVLAGLLPQDPPRALRPPSEPATVGEHLGDLW